MDASRVDRINELYRRSQAVGLTKEEKEEQARLHQECVAAIQESLRNSLSDISIKGPNGSITNLGKKYGGVREVWCIVKRRL